MFTHCRISQETGTLLLDLKHLDLIWPDVWTQAFGWISGTRHSRVSFLKWALPTALTIVKSPFPHCPPTPSLSQIVLPSSGISPCISFYFPNVAPSHNCCSTCLRSAVFWEQNCLLVMNTSSWSVWCLFFIDLENESSFSEFVQWPQMPTRYQHGSGEPLWIRAALPSASPPCNDAFKGSCKDWQWWGSPFSYLTPLPLDLIRSKIPGRVEAGLLHPKGRDEDIDDDCDEDESCCSIVEYI